MSKLLYNLFLILYSVAIRVAAIANPKARKWISGRRDIFATINGQLSTGNDQPIWMHCASLGEFEQGRPLLEELKSQNSKVKIVLTFFSPSGYEVMKDYKGADHVFYLPMDSPANAKKFLDAVNPALVLWVKYEYWFYYLTEIKQRNIPALLVSGIFRKGQPFFAWYGDIWRKMLQSFTHFFVQNEESSKLLATLGITENVTLNGDTRFDRVLEIAENFTPVAGIEEFCGDSPVIVAGSTWEEDEIELLHFVNVRKEVRFIIAPHEIDKTNLKDVKDEFPHSVFYSELINEQRTTVNGQLPTPNVLIIDNIGMLSRLYRYATITYVGGGYGADGVHNVLEAAVYGKPVVFGPVYDKFVEATGLVNCGGAVSVDGGPVKLETIMNNLLNDEAERKTRGEAAKQFVYENAGASKKIMQFIQEKRLLTN
ncbi:MAG: 3-deoxy-D-manno-octulosonic acid transferase [Ferruginibacter sp.]|nr:3-deoxy-D-manno-octulosonic acid transferase [Ferruginibacter sp.]